MLMNGHMYVLQTIYFFHVNVVCPYKTFVHTYKALLHDVRAFGLEMRQYHCVERR